MENFIEFQNWGFNTLIISSFMTMAFTVFQGYGFVMQGRKIFKKKSVESISPTTFFLFFFYFMAFILYGLEKKSLAMVFNGLLFIPVTPIVLGVFKFKSKFSVGDIVSFVLSSMTVPAMIIINNKDTLVSILLLVSLGALVSQLLVIFKNKSMGAVEIKFIVIFTVTALFWLIYAIGLLNYPLIFFNSAALLIYISIFVLYKKYKKQRR